jgi:2-polyprenyl-3-methyl-5-hydroxy-6-metoxy-1,4-benzoquinol methylase
MENTIRSITVHGQTAACPICRKLNLVYGEGDYYLPGKSFTDPLFACNDCDVIYRVKTPEELEKHFDVASYTRVADEGHWYMWRSAYFSYLADVAARHIKEASHALDFGTSYGHFMGVLKDKGFSVMGVELSDEVRERCRQNGFTVYKTLEDLPSSARFDMITFIDSLYCLPQPVEMLGRIHQRLTDNGVLLLRITNRNWIIKVMKVVLRRSYFKQLLGDCTVSYSARGLRKLLERTGYKIKEILTHEGGKQDNWERRLFYKVTDLIARFTFKKVILSPGVIVIAEKDHLRRTPSSMRQSPGFMSRKQ